MLKFSSGSPRHKHRLETLFIHINPCIRIVLPFTGNVRQSIMHLKHFFIIKNFIFENFIFENFISRKFCLIIFDLILFYFKKKIQNLLFTMDRSMITVHRLLFIVLFTVVAIQYLYCNTILNNLQAFLIAIH